LCKIAKFQQFTAINQSAKKRRFAVNCSYFRGKTAAYFFAVLLRKGNFLVKMHKDYLALRD